MQIFIQLTFIFEIICSVLNEKRSKERKEKKWNFTGGYFLISKGSKWRKKFFEKEFKLNDYEKKSARGFTGLNF